MERLLNLKWILILAVSILMVSCNFRVVKKPGPQLSWSVSQSKENNTFICGYKLDDSIINGVKIESIFAEKKYSSDGGLFSGYNIDCCKSQLVIVSRDYLASDGTGFSVDWEIPNFYAFSSSIIYCDYNSNNFPDSIPLSVISLKDKRIIEKLTLHKVNNL